MRFLCWGLNGRSILGNKRVQHFYIFGIIDCSSGGSSSPCLIELEGLSKPSGSHSATPLGLLEKPTPERVGWTLNIVKPSRVLLPPRPFTIGDEDGIFLNDPIQLFYQHSECSTFSYLDFCGVCRAILIDFAFIPIGARVVIDSRRIIRTLNCTTIFVVLRW